MNLETLRDIAQTKYDDFVAQLERMVNVDCGSFSPEGVNAVVDMCQERFERNGWEVERHKHTPEGDQPQFGDLIIGKVRGAGGPNVIMIGHIDTVFDPGTAAERPFRIEGTRALGPGVSDMKAGLLTGIFATEVLQEAGFDEFGTITLVCNPDEEVGSQFSGPFIKQMAPENDASFVLESGREDGATVSGRKGITDYFVTVHGRAAHAGVEPEKGIHAVLEAAHLITALQALNGRWEGVSLNVGIARGGTRINVVPERFDMEIELRSSMLSTLLPAEEEAERILSTPTVPGARIEVVKSAWHRPMEKDERGQMLADLARTVGQELGVEVRDVASGGASDANTTSAAGVPTLDGLGPIGGGYHAIDEWTDLDSVVPRIALVAGMVTRL